MILRQRSILLLLALVEFLIILIGTYLIYINQSIPDASPTVMVINIEGEITTQFFGIYEKKGQNRTNGTSVASVIRMLEYFSKDRNIKAFILEFDAFGGQTAGQEELARYIKRMDKPVVAVVKGSALSSGYYVAASTDKIYAQESSKIGDIAQTFVYVNRERNNEEQICHITSSTYKNITLNDCHGFDPLLFERLRRYTQGTHELLVLRIAQMRNLSTDFLAPLSGDKIFNGQEALELGLVDGLGTTLDAVSWLEGVTGTKLNVVYLRDLMGNDEN